MTDRDRNAGRPLEETPEVESAVEDETTVPQLVTDGGGDADTPTFTSPDEGSADRPPTDDLIGVAQGGGSNNAADFRTGAEQPWEAEDLAKARGQDPTPPNVDRAQQDLDQTGAAAVERTVP
jgi:hypothetical protein